MRAWLYHASITSAQYAPEALEARWEHTLGRTCIDSLRWAPFYMYMYLHRGHKKSSQWSAVELRCTLSSVRTDRAVLCVHPHVLRDALHAHTYVTPPSPHARCTRTTTHARPPCSPRCRVLACVPHSARPPARDTHARRRGRARRVVPCHRPRSTSSLVLAPAIISKVQAN